jgi:hypothetical protein
MVPCRSVISHVMTMIGVEIKCISLIKNCEKLSWKKSPKFVGSLPASLLFGL